MDIKTPENTFQDVSYGEQEYDDLMQHLAENVKKDRHHLSLFLGIYKPNKKKALKQLEDKLNKKVSTVDTSDIVSRIESETYEKLDQFFTDMHESDDILYLKNGDKFSGVYTSSSHSHVKYATPQERYFLKKVKEFNGLVVIDIEEFSDADITLRRAAHSIVSFTLPESKLKRAFWHLRNFSPHGFEIKTTRPEAYGEAS